MSRYSMEFSVGLKTRNEGDTVREIVNQLWDLSKKCNSHLMDGVYESDDSNSFPWNIDLYGEKDLGEHPAEFSNRVAKKIWEFIGEFRPVFVRTTCLKELPYDEYELSEKEYKDFLKKGKS